MMENQTNSANGSVSQRLARLWRGFGLIFGIVLLGTTLLMAGYSFLHGHHVGWEMYQRARYPNAQPLPPPSAPMWPIIVDLIWMGLMAFILVLFVKYSFKTCRGQLSFNSQRSPSSIAPPEPPENVASK